MAVTAAPHGRVPGCVDVEQGKSTGRFRQAWKLISFVFTIQGCGTHQLALINRNNVFIATDHVQTRSCGRLNSPWIVTKPFDFSFQ